MCCWRSCHVIYVDTGRDVNNTFRLRLRPALGPSRWRADITVLRSSRCCRSGQCEQKLLKPISPGYDRGTDISVDIGPLFSSGKKKACSLGWDQSICILSGPPGCYLQPPFMVTFDCVFTRGHRKQPRPLYGRSFENDIVLWFRYAQKWADFPN